MNLLPDAVELVKIMKKASIEAVKATKPVEICFGKVTSSSPLQILVEQKLSLGESQLVLTRNVTDYNITITGGNIQDYYMETIPDASPVLVSPLHKHAIGKIEITVYNGLVVGDEVILCRQQEGQKYIVWDRIG